MALPTKQLLRCLVPLKLVVVTEGPNTEYSAIRTAIHRAFQGGQYSADSAEAYFAAGEDLGVSVLEADFSKGAVAARQIVVDARSSALHTFVIAVIHELPTKEFGAWLAEIDCAAQPDDEDDNEGEQEEKDKDAASGPVSLLPIVLKEGAWQGATECLDYLTLDEYALRPASAAAYALAWSWKILGSDEDKLSLFISHAKLDGLPLANSFRYQLQNLKGMQVFYDALHIPPGSNWKTILRKGVERSVVVALRTNVYEERAWCVQEMDWAEDFGCPLVMVDARTQLVRGREFLPIAGSPCVHVPDGNLVRVLQSALREALRVRLFAGQVQALEDCGAISALSTLKAPRTSLATLGLRCESLARSGKAVTHVFVPEKFRETHRRVAERLVKCYFPGAWLGTPQMLVNEIVAATP